MTGFGPAIDTRPLYPRERGLLLDLLSALPSADWDCPTVCPGWTVHDIVGHVLNDYLRRLSGSRDGHRGAVFADDETLPAYLARTNEEFVRAARQCSPAVMTGLLAHLGPQLDELWAARDLDAPADLDVSWAADDRPSPAWLDIARDYTEFWVHQQQIRDAVERPGAEDPELMAPVIDTFMRALPHSLRDQDRPIGTAVGFTVTGPSGGDWLAVSTPSGWRLGSGADLAARVTMDQDAFWRLATRGIPVEAARERSSAEGDRELVAAATSLLAIVR
ncbi:maleylpyruvate isomerase family mycothiol-dependent enzyme [Saccharopolyspora taberi]|uniref:Maleylpyruvate isomerase family mycothiol-dependent enzyme n=1 Tax=Saccharopolyspora taberi TaxID=60895 RepID=A0ABN3VED9_9PSEU